MARLPSSSTPSSPRSHGWTHLSWVLPSGAAAALALLGCGGSTGLNQPPRLPPTLNPLGATLAQGQSLRYVLTSVPTAGVTWTVAPPAGGTFGPNGLFTAGWTPGTYTITASFTLLGQPAALSTVLTVSLQPLAADLNPNVVLANGGDQAGGALNNATAFSESFGLKPSINVSGSLQNQPGFDLVPGAGHRPRPPR